MTRTKFRRKPLAATTVSRPAANGPSLPGDPTSSNGEAAAAGPLHTVGDELTAEERALPLMLIDPSPWQKRKDFSGLEALADSMKTLGLRQAVLVRPKAGRYELLAGERRLRAARLADWTQIRASIQPCDDATAKQIVLVENLQREDLNPIEEAQQWQELLQGPGAPTQTALAARLGVTQGHIANRLRLLKLPQPIREYVISGEIPPSVARGLVQIADVPAITAKIVEQYQDAKKRRKSATVAEILDDEYDGLPRIIEDSTREMGGQSYLGKLGKRLPTFTPTPEQRAALDIREFPDPYGGRGDTQERACNVELWNELQAAHEAALIAKYGKKDAPQAAAAGGDGKQKPLTPAQQKAAAEEEKRKKAERRAQLAKRRKSLVRDRLRGLIAEKVLGGVSGDELLELTTLAALKGWADGYKANHVDRAVGRIKNRPIAERAQRMIAECFWDSAKDCPSTIVGEWAVKEVFTVAEFLSIDLAAAWKRDQMGPLSEAWWNVHDREELVAIARQAHHMACDLAKKGELVKWLTEAKNLPVPAELDGKKAGGKPTKKGKPKRGGQAIAVYEGDDEDDDFDEE